MQVFKHKVFLIALSLFFFFIIIGFTQWKASAQGTNYYSEGPSGGAGGAEWNEQARLPSIENHVAQIIVMAGDFIDGISFVNTYPNRSGLWQSYWHGGTGGNVYPFEIPKGERLVAITGTYGEFVNQIQFITSSGKSSIMYGGTKGPVKYYYRAAPGCEIIGFHGRSGQYLDAIGPIIKCK